MSSIKTLLAAPFYAMLLPAFVAFADKEPWDSALHREIETIAFAEIANSQTPSLQISIGKNEKLIYEGAFGLADIERNLKATVKTKYRTASIAKWLTSTAALRLVEQGLLDLDTPVQKYCPDCE